MAICKFGTIVVGVRGTVGGLTFTEGRSGPYCKSWSKPSNPRTSFQQTTRGRLTECGDLWWSMSSAQRAAWDTFAASPPETSYNSLGEVVYLSGWNWLCRVNQRRQSVGLATTTTVPTNSPASQPASCALTISELPAGSASVSWTAGDFPAGTSAMLFLSVHPTDGRQSKSSGFKLTWAEQAPSGTSKTITTLLQDRFGDIRQDWSVFAELYQLRDDGVRSVVRSASTVVT